MRTARGAHDPRPSSPAPGMSADATDIVAPTVEGPAAAMRACLADAGLGARGRRLCQRPWDRHQGQRPDRDGGDQAGLRRPCRQALGVLDQIDARPLHGCLGRARDDRLRDGDPRRCGAADRQLPAAGPRLRPRRDAQRRAGAPGRARRASATPSLLAAPTPRWRRCFDGGLSRDGKLFLAALMPAAALPKSHRHCLGHLQP